MLLKKDELSRGLPAKSKKKPANKGAKTPQDGKDISHLATDNILHHTCKLKYPGLGGNTGEDGSFKKPLSVTRKQSIGSKNHYHNR